MIKTEHRIFGAFIAWVLLGVVGCTTTRGTGDLGLVIERELGSVKLIEHTGNSQLATIAGLGDLSHASIVFSRDARYAYVFGRDGGLTKVDLLKHRIDKRVMVKREENDKKTIENR